MTRSAYTSGPWTYEYNPYTSHDDREIPAFQVHGEHKVCETNEDRPPEEQEANARLIAAAPSLLNAASLVIDRWTSGDLADAVRQLDAAMTEANGG
jgi:hypothetical protein